jgi:1-acyl-sn-glycerol-3-phosphate acyltransferase
VFALNLHVRVLIKHTLFIGPVGWFLRFCGGIPIDRRAARDYVSQMAQEFEKNEVFHLVVTPEATRSPRTHWKTGFYHMAMAANVPILLAAIDVDKKAVGVDRIMHPSGDLDADMAEIYAFFDNVRGIKAGNYASPNKPAPDDG